MLTPVAIFAQTKVEFSVIPLINESTEIVDFLRVTDIEKPPQPEPTGNFLRVIDLERQKPGSSVSSDKSANADQIMDFLRVVDLENPSKSETPNKPLNTEEINNNNQQPSQTPAVKPVAESPVSQSPLIPPVDPQSVAAKWDVLPIGIIVGGRNVISSTLVRGTEDGSGAIQFDDWLVSYEVIIKALNIRVTNLPNGQVQLRSPTVAFNLDFSRLRLDPEIGAVLSIRDVKDWFGVTPEFDINNYAIQIKYPRVNKSGFTKAPVESPIDFTNIPYISAPAITLTTINNQETAQSIRSRANQNRIVTSSGSLLGGAWVLRLNQIQTENEDTWRLGSASYTLQQDTIDLFVGSQAPFWRTTSPNPFWGVTTVKRWGFTMPPGNGGSSNIRIQPQRFGQTVRGKVEPGTLVQLVPRYSQQILAEVLVGESGEYQFNDIILPEVRLLLYPQGKLTAQPEERIINLPIIIGQLPERASALLLSAGTGRNNFYNSKEFLGTFSDLRTAASYRYGVSQELTLGVGAIYEDDFRGLAELFFQPQNSPLQITASALTPISNRDWEISSNIRYNPTSNFQANLFTDLRGSRLRLNQTILPNLSVFGNFDYDYHTTNSSSPFRYNIGTRTSLLGRKIFGSLVLQWDSMSNLQWNFTGRTGNFELKHLGNDFSTLTTLNYDLLNNTSSKAYNAYNTLALSYQTLSPFEFSSSPGNSLLTLSWRYKPNNSKFEVELGYGIGSEGSGIVTNFSQEIFSGMFLQASYSNIALGSDTDRFRLALSSCFDFDRGFCQNDSFRAIPRISNGILFVPFLDQNNNGIRDGGEPLITKKLRSLLIVNNSPVSQYQSEVSNNGIVVSLNPGLYRLDLDPSGYPLDWTPTKNTAVAIEVAAGGFTEIAIPFAQSYTITGKVIDSEGRAIAGAKIEAVSTTSNQRVFSITGPDGVYYLEGLSDRNYQLLINNIPAEPQTIDLTASPEPYQQLNLKLNQ
ncbi:carboxypeptidase-like regulatory domain-containing protein [Cronbergia sp. UHCC 0137]|uniref:carboxypeptidase-like regulatory domain-containing protein n=1 Tax=Cronbergia sp. UHCC 0137 TaxID=3110239 RepID=UPI002B21AB28|nr:carboxypeptidase-like regulatory domain-containing protein [Cronbergia sp. UHCC 0137]MEA5617293.1 carboxypeptidase-like regulatory domain-containing protein [Cronbergia sp. UHCC 0137]